MYDVMHMNFNKHRSLVIIRNIPIMFNKEEVLNILDPAKVGSHTNGI